MEPILRRDRMAEQATAEDVLGDEGDKRRVMGIVVEGVATADSLDDETSGFVDHLGVTRLAAAESAPISEGQVLA